jgi:protein-disulfide isomerase
MGGAARSNRARKQRQAEKAIAPGRSIDRSTIIALVVVAVVVAAVVGGLLLTRNRSVGPPTAAAPASVTYTASAGSDGVVTAGSANARVTIDIYEDFLCPYCGQLFQQSHAEIDKALADGSLRVRFHLINMLDRKSNPPGYSLESANAALCAADTGRFQDYYNSLYTKQPREGGPGYTVDQLVQLAKDLNAGAAESCIRTGTHKPAVQAAYTQAITDLTPLLGDQVGTPTVVSNGKVIQALANPAWLSDLLKPTP